MIINVNDFKDRSCDSDMLQAALDAAYETGEAVVVPKINARTGKDVWDISKTVRLHSGNVLLLMNSHLRLADGVICHMFTNTNARTPAALADDGKERDITIRGIGRAVLDGGIHNGIYEINGISRKIMKKTEYDVSYNSMLFFQNVENLVIENITVKDQRYWAFSLYAVVYSRVSNIHFISSSNVPNQDGVDLLKGCHDVIVENISGCTGDNIIALLATDDAIYQKVSDDPRDGDIYNVTIRNVVAYGVGGCALIRILNHDGFRIYNVHIDNVIEASPWSVNDSPVAPNPDLAITTDDEGNNIYTRTLVPGEEGYRCEAAILIGESYWYSREKAKMGDTYGISVSNVMTHARYAVFINNTLLDSSFDNIRLFGNGFMAAYFGEGRMENVRFTNISYDKNCRPLKADEHIWVEWNKTKSDGFYCVYFNGTEVDDIFFDNMYCSEGMEAVFGGHGSGRVRCGRIQNAEIPDFSKTCGIEVERSAL